MHRDEGDATDHEIDGPRVPKMPSALKVWHEQLLQVAGLFPAQALPVG
jgi:hypothetical protein